MQEELHYAQYAPISKAGFWLGRSPMQLLAATIGLALIFAPVAVTGVFRPLAWNSIGGAVIITISVIKVGYISLWQWGRLRMKFWKRKMRHGGAWSLTDAEAEQGYGHILLPAAVGEQPTILTVGDTSHGIAVMIDRVAGTVSIVLSVDVAQWDYTAVATKNGRVEAVTTFLRLMGEIPAMSQIIIQSRRVTVTKQQTAHNNQRQLVEADRVAVENNYAQHPLNQELLIFQFKLNQLGVSANSSAQTIAGACHRQISMLIPALKQAGVQDGSITVLSRSELRGLSKQLWDNYITGAIPSLPDTTPTLSNFKEYSSYVEIGDKLATTLWIDQLPNKPFYAGFMGSLETIAGTQVITQIFRTQDNYSAEKEIHNQKSELENMKKINTKIGRETPEELQRNLEELERRQEEIKAGLGNIQTKTYITIYADNKDQLDGWVNDMNTQLVSLTCHAEPLKYRQREAWATSLPIGITI